MGASQSAAAEREQSAAAESEQLRLDEELVQAIEGDIDGISIGVDTIFKLIDKGANPRVVDINGACYTLDDENASIEDQAKELYEIYHGAQRHMFPRIHRRLVLTKRAVR
jgi:hypothetical protein